MTFFSAEWASEEMIFVLTGVMKRSRPVYEGRDEFRSMKNSELRWQVD
jgi:hypothetical protein